MLEGQPYIQGWLKVIVLVFQMWSESFLGKSYPLASRNF